MYKVCLTICLVALVLGLFLFLTRRSQPSQVSDRGTVASSTIDWVKASSDARKYAIRFEDVESAVAAGAKFYDVRGVNEYHLSHFKGAENWPLQELKRGRFPQLSPDTPIYLHCQSGKRSAQAAKLFRETGFRHVFDLGGLEQVRAIGGKSF